MLVGQANCKVRNPNAHVGNPCTTSAHKLSSEYELSRCIKSAKYNEEKCELQIDEAIADL